MTNDHPNKFIEKFIKQLTWLSLIKWTLKLRFYILMQIETSSGK